MLIALGPEKSAEIFKHLNEDEIEELTLQIANMRMVSSEEKQQGYRRFLSNCFSSRVYIRRWN